MIAMLGVIGGALDGRIFRPWDGRGRGHAAWGLWRRSCRCPRAFPLPDTYRRVFERLGPAGVRAMFPGLGRPDCRGHWGTGYPH